MAKRQTKTIKIPMRQCAACRGRFPKKTLMRIVRSADGDVSFDLSGKMNGRGIYLCRNLSCIESARKSGCIKNALGVDLSDAGYEELYNEVRDFDKK